MSGQIELENRQGFEADMSRSGRWITDHDVLALWNTGWREALMASWWASIRRFEGAEYQIRKVLDPRYQWAGYPGLVHFVALARLNTDQSREILRWVLRRKLEYWDLAAAAAAAQLIGIKVKEDIDGLERSTRNVKAMLALAARVAGERGELNDERMAISEVPVPGRTIFRGPASADQVRAALEEGYPELASKLRGSAIKVEPGINRITT
jgi:hypothetical protein